MPPQRRNMTEPSGHSKRRRSTATTPQGRENQLVSLAADLAEQQMLSGTASAQVITHYLKLGSSREILEQERLRHENELLKVKRESIASQQRIEELYVNAINAMRAYSGSPPVEQSDE